jgi:hypothetical protein
MAYANNVLVRHVRRVDRLQPSVTIYLLAPACTRQQTLDLIALLRRQNPDAMISLAGDRVTVRE